MNPLAADTDRSARLGLVMLRSMEEILGQGGVDMIFRLADLPVRQQDLSFEALSVLQSALEQVYGPRAGRGIALRIGRCGFQHLLRIYGSELLLNDATFRLLPLTQKLERSMTILSDLLSSYGGQRVGVKKSGERFVWEIEQCLLCRDRQAETPVCYLIIGLLQESLYWASGGKIFNVTETTCMACGDSLCTLEIDLLPIG